MPSCASSRCASGPGAWSRCWPSAPGHRARPGRVVDQAVIASLEAEPARWRRARAVDDRRRARPAAVELEQAEADLAAARRRSTPTGPSPGADGAAAEVRGELARCAPRSSRAGPRAARARRAALANSPSAHRRPRRRGRPPARRAGRAAEAEEPLVARLDAAEQRRLAAEAVWPSAESSAGATPRPSATRWEARAEALALALDEARAAAGAERLADVAGVVGTLLDVVEVDPGWEAAFERRPATPSPPWSSTTWPPAAGPRRAARRAPRGAVLALGARSPLVPRHRRACRCGPRAGIRPPRRRGPARRALGAAVVVDGGWPRPSTWRSPTPTPSWSPATATGSAQRLAHRRGRLGCHGRRARRGPPAGRRGQAAEPMRPADDAVAHGPVRAASTRAVRRRGRPRPARRNDGRAHGRRRCPVPGRDRPARRGHRGEALRGPAAELADRLERERRPHRRARGRGCPPSRPRRRAGRAGEGDGRGPRSPRRAGRPVAAMRNDLGCAPPALEERRQFLASGSGRARRAALAPRHRAPARPRSARRARPAGAGHHPAAGVRHRAPRVDRGTPS
jgi:chromosome segregation protein